MASSSNPGTLHELVLEHIAIDSRGTGGNVKCTCRHCNKTFTVSLTRQVAHISGRTGSGVAVCKGLDDYSFIATTAVCRTYLPHPTSHDAKLGA